MTTAEHQLIIEMFKQHTVYYAGLVEALKSRGVLDPGNLQAFDSLVVDSTRDDVERHTKDEYLATAAILGVKIDDTEII